MQHVTERKAGEILSDQADNYNILPMPYIVVLLTIAPNSYMYGATHCREYLHAKSTVLQNYRKG